MSDDANLPKRRTSKGEIVGKLLAAFEAAAHADDDGVQYWYARDLAPMLGYQRWENFKSAIDRAKLSCGNSGEDVSDHFRDTTKLILLAKGAQREIEDVELTRFACYLIHTYAFSSGALSGNMR